MSKVRKFVGYFGLLCLTVALFSCEDGIKQALEYAGDNKKELTKVLRYYTLGSDIQSSEKLAAARFLIKNMPGHMSMVGDYEEYCKSLDSVLTDDNLSEVQLDCAIDSIYHAYFDCISYFPSATIVSSEYLIENIEQAYALWKSGSWAEHLDFDHFCEYLLPFICTEGQPIDDWREKMEPFAKADIDKLGECYDYKNNPTIAVSTVNGAAKRMLGHMSGQYQSPLIPIYDPFLFAKFPHPFSCNETSDMANMVMRAKGLPVAVDFTPQWPDGHHGHSWTVLWSTHGKAETFSPFWSPLGVPFISHRRFAKVFRKTYACNSDYQKLVNEKNSIPNFVGTEFFQDVSDEYTATSDILVQLNRKVRGGKACIAVFDNSKWRPVWYGKVRGKKASFSNMGRDVTYIVLAPFHGSLIPASSPFRLDRLGNVEYLEKSDSTVDIRIWRKYPLRRHICNLSTIGNGQIEASNDLRNWDTVSVIARYPLTSDVLIYEQPLCYRYWRYTSSAGSISDMSEIYYYGTEDANPRYDFQLIGEDSGIRQLYDGDPQTFYSAEEGEIGGIVDFGVSAEVSKIEYINRGDGNAITPGDEYRISYWDSGRWNTLKQCLATDVFIDIERVPAGCLYFIENLSSGEDNRIFVWDNETCSQIWY